VTSTPEASFQLGAWSKPLITTSYNFKESDIKFVNRTMEAYQVVMCHVNNTSTTSISNLDLPLLTQPHGAGKSMFARHYLSVLDEEQWQDIATITNEGELTDRLRNAKHLHLDFRVFDPETTINGFLNENVVRQLPEEVRNLVSDISTGSILKALEVTGPWVVCFDEIDAITAPDNTEILRRETSDIELIIAVWKYIAKFLQSKNVYPIVCNKSPLLWSVHKRWQELTEIQTIPSQILPISLPSLSQKYIKQILNESFVRESDHGKQPTVTEMLKVMGLPEHDIDHFCDSIYHYTGGVPRSIKNVIVYITDHNPSLSSREQQQQVLELAYSGQKNSDISPVYISNPNWRRLFYGFITTVTLGIPLDMTQTIVVRGIHRPITVLEAVSRFNLYFEQLPNSNEIMIRIGKYVMRSIESGSYAVVSNNFMVSLCKNWTVSNILDQGSVLEELLILSLVNHFLSELVIGFANVQTKKWKDVIDGIFSECFFADWNVEIAEKDMVIMCCGLGGTDSIPIVTPELMKYPWSKRVPCNPNGYKFLCSNGFIRAGHISHPARRSKSADVMIGL
jgi:hypothetical protein